MLNIKYFNFLFFLFFNGAYSFLSFWISITYFYEVKWFFAWGVVLYLFLILFHRGIIKILKDTRRTINKNLKINLFFIFLILFSIFYLTGTYFIQELVINNFEVSSDVFRIVNSVLVVFSLIISFLFSFFEKKEY
ncbi:MAG: hypothetical protein PHN37_02460 [Candidatus Pacebacteria bacterium]|nr:hypothetical protein [Candidatus Paceibacterota bacterium]